MSYETDVFGNGSDGAFSNGVLVKGQEYNFTSFYLDTAITLGAGDGNKLVIRCQGDFEITAEGSITSTADADTLDTATVTVNGVAYSVASTNGSNGTAGNGAGAISPFGIGGVDGANGAAGNYGPVSGYTTPSLGGAGGAGQGTGFAGGGGGGRGGYGRDYSGSSYPGGDGGNGGGTSSHSFFQNGIIIIAKNCVLAGTIACNGMAGGSGYAGSAGENITSQWANAGGGGGGGAGGRGSGGGLVRIISATKTGTISVTATAGSGGSGGAAGAAGVNYHPSGGQGTAGIAGTAGTAGTAGAIAYTAIPLPPEVTTNDFSDIEEDSVNIDGEITNDQGTAVTERGFYYVAGKGTPTTSDSSASDVGAFAAGVYDKDITGLTTDGLFTFRAFAKNITGTGLADTWTTVQLNSGKTTVPGTTGAITATIEPLLANSKYYIRAYATNSEGTAYGEETSFTTTPDFIPRVIIGG